MKGTKREKGMEERREKGPNCGNPPSSSRGVHSRVPLGAYRGQKDVGWGLWAGVCIRQKKETTCTTVFLCPHHSGLGWGSLPILPWGLCGLLQGPVDTLWGSSRKLVRKQDPPPAH